MPRLPLFMYANHFANEMQTKRGDTGQHQTTQDNTKPRTGQHRTTPDGQDNTNSIELENR
jgi:hypothetical protein